MIEERIKSSEIIMVSLNNSFSAPRLVRYMPESAPKALPSPEPFCWIIITAINKTAKMTWIKFTVACICYIIQQNFSGTTSEENE